ncbi:MAG: hypothetical protein IV100_02520 [Myxococcales bacterium]|nr:hypothetical protein [Myxococcales bacterium]
MENTERNKAELVGELTELLDTVLFSVETVRMALAIGRLAMDPLANLQAWLASSDEEEREAGNVAVEALEHAAVAFCELARVLSEDHADGISLELRFWSTYEWCRSRLFDPSVTVGGQASLRAELLEAQVRLESLRQRISSWCQNSLPVV